MRIWDLNSRGPLSNRANWALAVLPPPPAMGLINHKILPVCFICFSVTDRTFAYLQRVTFLCYAVQFRPLNKKCRAFKSSTPIGLRHIGVRILISERLDVRGIKCKFLKFSAKLVSGCTALVRNWKENICNKMLKEICKYLQQTSEVLEAIVKYIKAFATGLKILENIFRLLAQALKC